MQITIFRRLRAPRTLLALGLVLGLAACATVTNAPDPTTTAPAADQGIGVVSVTGNTAQVSQFDQITVRKLPGPNAPASNVREQHILRNDLAVFEAQQKAKQK